MEIKGKFQHSLDGEKRKVEDVYGIYLEHKNIPKTTCSRSPIMRIISIEDKIIVLIFSGVIS